MSLGPAEVALLQAGAAGLGIRVDAGALKRLSRFLDLLQAWNKRVRLTAERDLQGILQQHVIDSLAPAPWLPDAGLVVDIGSGGGFPGIVLGCLRPDLELALIDSRRKPISFLREALRNIPLPNATVFGMRSEDAAQEPRLAGRAAVVVSRAIRLPVFVDLALPFLHPEGSIVAMQTPRTAAETPTLAGVRVAERRTYRLPRGQERILLRFLPEPVP